MTRGLAGLALALTLGVTSGAAALDVPRLERRVTDRAALLDPPDENRLTATLELYQKDTAHQFALLTIPGLEGEVLEEYSIEVVEAWGLGSEKFDNGLLVLVARDDRKVRIEVGDGLEGVITDALSARIIREVIVPAFRARDFTGGLESAFDLLMQAGRGEPVAFEDAWGQSVEVSGGSDFGFIALIFFIFLVIVLVSMFGGGGGGGGYRHRPWSGSSFGGGGFSSGGFSSGGGFSGGGGSFGGGGASGSW